MSDSMEYGLIWIAFTPYRIHARWNLNPNVKMILKIVFVVNYKPNSAEINSKKVVACTLVELKRNVFLKIYTQ